MSVELKNIGRVLIADDHSIITERICEIVNQCFLTDDLFVFTDSDKAIEEIKRKTFDLYILDLEFKGMAGFDLIKIIRNKNRDAKIIINTMHDQIWTIYQLQQLDVNAILLKSAEGLPTLLIKNAIEKSLNGESFYSQEIDELKYKIQSYKRNLKTKKSIPTEAELAVLKYIVKGHTSSEIGKQLCISENTVEGHRKNLLIKLDAKNVAQLVAIAFQNRLVE